MQEIYNRICVNYLERRLIHITAHGKQRFIERQYFNNATLADKKLFKDCNNAVLFDFLLESPLKEYLRTKQRPNNTIAFNFNKNQVYIMNKKCDSLITTYKAPSILTILFQKKLTAMAQAKKSNRTLKKEKWAILESVKYLSNEQIIADRAEAKHKYDKILNLAGTTKLYNLTELEIQNILNIL